MQIMSVRYGENILTLNICRSYEIEKFRDFDGHRQVRKVLSIILGILWS